MYEAFDEKGLDTALAIMEHKAPAKVESSGEETPSDPAKRDEIVLRTRWRSEQARGSWTLQLTRDRATDSHEGPAVAGGHAIARGRAAAEHEGTI